jgi:hypothetical protein
VSEPADDIRPTWELFRCNDGSFDRFRLKAAVTAQFVEPTRDEVRSALMQILDEALGPESTELEIGGWESNLPEVGLIGAYDGLVEEMDSFLAYWFNERIDLFGGAGQETDIDRIDLARAIVNSLPRQLESELLYEETTELDVDELEGPAAASVIIDLLGAFGDTEDVKIAMYEAGWRHIGITYTDG